MNIDNILVITHLIVKICYHRHCKIKKKLTINANFSQLKQFNRGKLIVLSL